MNGFLIVDDVSINNYIVKEMLQKYNAPVDVAESGAEAVDRVKGGNVYDIIFMDHMMPDMDGIEATGIIRAAGYKGCIVALTANISGENEEMYMDSGFDRFISKPIDPFELDSVVNEFITRGTCQDPAPRATAAADDSKVSTEIAGMEEYFIMDAEHAISVLEELLPSSQDLTPEQIETLEITMHGIKSAFRNVGNEEMSDVAYKMELAAKTGDTTIMESDIPAFLEQLKDLVAIMKD